MTTMNHMILAGVLQLVSRKIMRLQGRSRFRNKELDKQAALMSVYNHLTPVNAKKFILPSGIKNDLTTECVTSSLDFINKVQQRYFRSTNGETAILFDMVRELVTTIEEACNNGDPSVFPVTVHYYNNHVSRERRILSMMALSWARLIFEDKTCHLPSNMREHQLCWLEDLLSWVIHIEDKKWSGCNSLVTLDERHKISHCASPSADSRAVNRKSCWCGDEEMTQLWIQVGELYGLRIQTEKVLHKLRHLSSDSFLSSKGCDQFFEYVLHNEHFPLPECVKNIFKRQVNTIVSFEHCASSPQVYDQLQVIRSYAWPGESMDVGEELISVLQEIIVSVATHKAITCNQKRSNQQWQMGLFTPIGDVELPDRENSGVSVTADGYYHT